MELRNRFSPLCNSFGQCACTEAHALFEESAESHLLMPLLDPKRMKPEYQGYKWLQIAIDSGASASVIPEGLLNGHKVKPSEGSRAGVSYLAADGGRIPNLGETQLGLVAKEHHRCRITFQVADVERPLLA
eukprot:15404955-Alexandrium_andersonii.AAC.1